MSRKSTLTDEQKQQLKIDHEVNGIVLKDLSVKYGKSASTLHEILYPRKSRKSLKNQTENKLPIKGTVEMLEDKLNQLTLEKQSLTSKYQSDLQVVDEQISLTCKAIEDTRTFLHTFDEWKASLV